MDLVKDNHWNLNYNSVLLFVSQMVLELKKTFSIQFNSANQNKPALTGMEIFVQF